MRYRTIGSSDLQVSEISLGSWLTYSGGVEADAIRACTDAAFEAGINFFDTTNVYGRGAAKPAWGEILSGRPRNSYILATKVWGQMSDDPDDRGLSGAQIAKQIDASLARLQTDYVDLYQAHRSDTSVAIEETIEALQQVVADGKARYLGFSESMPEQIQAAIEIGGPDLFVSSQPQYSMLWQAPEAEVFALSDANGISQIVWSPLAQGLLTGKYRAGQEPPPDSRADHSTMNTAMDLVMNDTTLSAVERLRPIAVHTVTRWPSSRSRGSCGALRSRRRSSERRGPRRSTPTPPRQGSELSADVLSAIDEALADAPVTKPTPAPFAESGVTHR
jgi:aryl-alcohol dehydrogenase-like predicted oxidoreductase